MNIIPWRQGQKGPVKSLFDDDFWGPNLFTDWEKMIPSEMRQNWYPAIDLEEKNDRYIVRADLPGLKKEDIRVSLDSGVLTVAGERKTEEEKTENGYRRFERAYGAFSRSIHLGQNVDESKIKAQYRDGVLEIQVPKTDRAVAKKINIE